VKQRLSFILSGSLISRIRMSCSTGAGFQISRGKHRIQLPNAGFKKLFKVRGSFC
jgi:hypothetical protein